MKINYCCSLCGFECSSTKRRVKCLDCGKMALVEVQEEKIKPQQKEKKINPRQAQFIENKFIDDGKAFAADKKITKVLNKIGSVSPRPPKREPKYKNCERCNKEFRLYAGEYLCPRCSNGGK